MWVKIVYGMPGPQDQRKGNVSAADEMMTKMTQRQCQATVHSRAVWVQQLLSINHSVAGTIMSVVEAEQSQLRNQVMKYA